MQEMTKAQFLSAMAVDKKAVNGQLRFIMLRGTLGNAVFTEVPSAALEQTLAAFCAS